MHSNPLARALTAFGVWTASPWAFGAFILFAVLWLAFGKDSLDWHGVATLATWLMTLCIQRAEHRDTQAIHAKLDALIRATPAAQNNLTRLDEEEPETIEKRREQDEREG
jgi:low affinity Fe/Cu permease